jgi:hypothetical protein
MKKIVFAIALAAVFPALSQTRGSGAEKSQLDGTWELVSGQQLPKGARDIKIISGDTLFSLLTIRRKGSRFIQGVELTF